MSEHLPGYRTEAISRRSFLAAGGRLGVAAGLVVPLRASHRASHRHPRTRARDGLGYDGSLRSEPPPPPDFTSYVSRPDLTPPGVSVRAGTAFSGSGLAPMYIFCAPKSPLAANPGTLPYGTHPFPSGATPGLMILDTTGELVYFKPLPGSGEIPFNFRVQSYRGRPALTWFQGTVAGGHATAGHYVLADDTYQPIATVTATDYPCDLHEFILTPQGTALHTAYESGVRSERGASLIVGHAQEVDVASNELLFDWPCYPAVSPDLSYVERPASHAPYDYFHMNSIDLWPGAERDLLISSRNTSTVYLVDRATGDVRWRLGGRRSDFGIGQGAGFYFQHDARALADGSGVSLFDDASQPCPERFASGKVLTLDGSLRTAALTHRYRHTDGELDTPSQGNCQLLGDDGHVVGWGYRPFFSVYGPSGAEIDAPLILDGRIPDGAASYRTLLFDWTGHPPLSELSLVVRRRDPSGDFSAWVSWNGATEVSHWLLRAGPSAADLEVVATAPRQGFETAIDFTRARASAFDVAAIDAAGQLLGRSAAVTAA